MSWKHWTAVVLVIGVGIVWQIPRHDEAMEGRPPGVETPAPAAATDAPAGPYRTVALEVAGMT